MGTAFLTGQTESKRLIVEKIEVSGTWTVPEFVDKIYVWMCGGGGAGQTVNGSGGYGNTSSAGNGGASNQVILNVTPGQTFNIVIGAGGVGDGASGGTTSFDVYSAGGGSRIPPDNTGGNYGSGNAFGGVTGDSPSTTANPSYVVTGGSPGQPGNGSGPSYTNKNQGGYCPLTNEVYCGGGCSGWYIYWNSSSTGLSYSYPEVQSTQPGGGGHCGSISQNGLAATCAGTPGGNGTAYGAGGGCTSRMSSFSYGGWSGVNGNGANGVVIIGYYK